MLWIAMFGGGEVRRYTTDGRVLDRVPVPVRDPTSVAFVGPALDRLLITTSRHTLSDEEAAASPDAGRLFLADVGVTGLPSPAWAGTSERAS
jgi:sugar lactone lactonase YvrE